MTLQVIKLSADCFVHSGIHYDHYAEFLTYNEKATFNKCLLGVLCLECVYDGVDSFFYLFCNIQCGAVKPQSIFSEIFTKDTP